MCIQIVLANLVIFVINFFYPCTKILAPKINFWPFLKNALFSQKSNCLMKFPSKNVYFIYFTFLVFKLPQKQFSQNAKVAPFLCQHICSVSVHHESGFQKSFWELQNTPENFLSNMCTPKTMSAQHKVLIRVLTHIYRGLPSNQVHNGNNQCQNIIGLTLQFPTIYQ